MQLLNLTRTGLIDYTMNQINNFFPSENITYRPLIDAHLDEALKRLHICINSVRCWRMNEFNYLQSSQYCTYLYFLSNSIWKNIGDHDICTKLFLLNKALNGIDCFYEIELPELFYIPHSIGIVLAKATYSNYLVLYQNSTVGKNHGIAPLLGEGVIMYPNTAIIGRCTIGDHTVVAQGTSVINTHCAGNSIVFNTLGAGLASKPIVQDVWEDIFRK